MLHHAMMIPDSKTVLEWCYEPDGFFEEGFEFELPEGKVSAAKGRVKGVFGSDYYDQGRKFREYAHARIADVFMAQQVQVHHEFELSEASMMRLHKDGRREVMAFPETIRIKVSLGCGDLVVRNADGEIVQDTRAERLQKQEAFRSKVVSLAQDDLALKRMLQIFRTALSDTDNLLIHLYEVREALVSEYGGEANVMKALNVSLIDWKWFGRLANNEPVKEGRHRGKHQELRPATSLEKERSIAFVQALVEAYVDGKADGSVRS